MQKKMNGVAMMVMDQEGRVLVGDRHMNQGIGLPGGSVDEGEDLWNAATRELLEETGVKAISCADSFIAESQSPKGIKYNGIFICKEYDTQSMKDTWELSNLRWVDPKVLISGEEKIYLAAWDTLTQFCEKFA